MIESEGKYYLYRHIRLDKNEVFYVGIGTKLSNRTTVRKTYCRAYSKNRNPPWKRVVNKTDYRVEIMFESDDYKFIQDKEIEFIALYGRKNLGTGTLCNLTDGGERNLGYIMSQETKNKLSILQTGKKHSLETKKKLSILSKNKKVSEETRKKHSENRKGQKHSEETKEKFRNIPKNTYIQKNMNGEIVAVFPNKQALTDAGFSYSSVLSVCLGQRNTLFGYKWESVNKKKNI